MSELQQISQQISRQISSGTVVVEANKRVAAASVLVSHLDSVRRRQHILKSQHTYRIDFSLTQRCASRMRFERWAANRYEQPGRLFVVPPGETLAVWNDVGRETVIVCDLHTDIIDPDLDAPFETDLLDASANIVSDALSRLMLQLREEVCYPGFASELMIEGLSLQLAAELQRHYRQASSAQQSGALAAWRLRRIDERLESADESVTLAELAALCGISIRQLSRGFRASRGVSLGHHVARMRIAKAKAALSSDRCIKLVATELGFRSTAAFSFAFRKATGMTPTAFRRLQTSQRR